LGDPDVGGRIILKFMYRYWDDGMNLIDLAQNRDRLRALVTAVMNLRVPKNEENSLTGCETVSLSKRILLHGVSFVKGVKDTDRLYMRHVYVTLAAGYKSAVLCARVRPAGHTARPATLLAVRVTIAFGEKHPWAGC
jgi:hypothetical protein